ncbi:hypothetical protein L6R46_26745 [Myxococcota bacterium]|nr:hypothetical protein [Myxococcota bacterium]
MSGWAWGPRPPEPVLDAVGARGITAFFTGHDAPHLARRWRPGSPPRRSRGALAYAAGFFARRRGQLLLHLHAALRPPLASGERVVTLNMGLGRDSLAMLALLIEGTLVAEGRPLRPADVDTVDFSDPGFEWAYTYALLPRGRQMCALHGLRLIMLQKPDLAVAAATLRQLPPPGDASR